MMPFNLHRHTVVLLLAVALCLVAGCGTLTNSDDPSPLSVSSAPSDLPAASASPSSVSETPASSSHSSASVLSPSAGELADEAEQRPGSDVAKKITDSLGVSVAVAVAPPPIAARDNTAVVLTPTASGEKVLGSGSVSIDASNTSQGYVMVKYTGGNSKVKLQITLSGGTTYTYNLRGGSYEVFPLTAGSGTYTINVYENVSGDQYALACGESVEVSLSSSLSPFLYPNQYVNFSSGSSTVTLGSELAGGAQTDLAVVEKVYSWVISNISYDFDKASNVTAGQMSGYLPSVDTIISTKKGICFDYAAVMATMLRSQGIPTKLVVGYAGQIYHAWVSVYLEGEGWVNGIIYFDGVSWVRMDPTFASSGNSSTDIMSYIGNGSNYNALLVY